MIASIALLVAPWLLFFSQLFTEFWHNPTYQVGLVAPLVIGYLAYVRWQSRPIPGQASHPYIYSALIAIGILLLLPLRLIFEANADWRLVIWAQGLLTVGLTALSLYRWGGAAYLRHFIILAILPLAILPWPTGLEKSVGTALMSGIGTLSVDVVRLLGHPAQAVGNIIYLPNGTTVGVEEACSGLRSLQGNLFAAGVIGELLMLTAGGRWALLLLGLVAALVFNLVRSLILVVSAALGGAQATQLLHDGAGWGILILSFITLYYLAGLFPTTLCKSAAPLVPILPRWLGIYAAALVGISWPLTSYYYPTLPASVLFSLPTPATVGLPDSVITADIKKFRAELFYNDGASWRWSDSHGDWVLFYLHWADPRLGRLGGAYHRPERCLPNTGWRLIGTPTPITLQTGVQSLPATLTHFTDGRRYATLFFAHYSPDGTDIGLNTYLSPGGRLADFVARRRLGSRTALQLAVISPSTSTAIDDTLVRMATRLLQPGDRH